MSGMYVCIVFMLTTSNYYFRFFLIPRRTFFVRRRWQPFASTATSSAAQAEPDHNSVHPAVEGVEQLPLRHGRHRGCDDLSECFEVVAKEVKWTVARSCEDLRPHVTADGWSRFANCCDFSVHLFPAIVQPLVFCFWLFWIVICTHGINFMYPASKATEEQELKPKIKIHVVFLHNTH